MEKIKDMKILEEIKLLKEKFEEIKRKEYIKSVSGGTCGIGLTFEYLIGKKADNESKPDFLGIELKTKRGYSNSDIGLFNINPKAEVDNVSKYLRDMYGYKDANDFRLKRLNVTVNAISLEKVGTKYLFKLKIDRKNEKIYLYILDLYLNIIDKNIYWDFKDIEERLYKKMKVLALIKAWPKKNNNIEYFKYYKMDIYILKSFDDFINLLEKGIIKVDFKIGNNYLKERYGKINSRGIGFVMKEENLKMLFDIY